MAKKKKMRIATYLIDKGLLTVEQAQEVMTEQEKKGGGLKDRFGRIAVNKGYISEKVLNKAVTDKEREEAGL